MDIEERTDGSMPARCSDKTGKLYFDKKEPDFKKLWNTLKAEHGDHTMYFHVIAPDDIPEVDLKDLMEQAERER